MEAILSTIHELENEYADKRIHVFDIQARSLAKSTVLLSGCVLNEEVLVHLQRVMKTRFPEWVVDLSEIQVLRANPTVTLCVNTNLVSLYTRPSFDSEMLSQILFGTSLEILELTEDWARIRQPDGYLGWVYRPYLAESVMLQATHLVVEPVSTLRAGPNPRAEVITRVFGGTGVQVLSLHDQTAQVIAHRKGWVELSHLRSQVEMPTTEVQRRAMMIQDAARMVGVPYLWGGTTANGIDCSGFAQLLHRWVGIAIPRDADMQYSAGKKSGPPFQPGDLVFFGNKDEDRMVSHVAISLGGWNVIHASRARNGVYIEDLQMTPKLRDGYLAACTFLG